MKWRYKSQLDALELLLTQLTRTAYRTAIR
jgi:hypothetical protein